MSIQKKSLISTLKTTRKANVASAPVKDTPAAENNISMRKIAHEKKVVPKKLGFAKNMAPKHLGFTKKVAPKTIGFNKKVV